MCVVSSFACVIACVCVCFVVRASGCLHVRLIICLVGCLFAWFIKSIRCLHVCSIVWLFACLFVCSFDCAFDCLVG